MEGCSQRRVGIPGRGMAGGRYHRGREQVSQRRRVGMPGCMYHGIGMPTLSPDMGEGGHAREKVASWGGRGGFAREPDVIDILN